MRVTKLRRRVLEALNGPDRYLKAFGPGWRVIDRDGEAKMYVTRYLGRTLASTDFLDQHVYGQDVYTLSERGRRFLLQSSAGA